MPTAHKLPSGAWRCQVYLGKKENGKNDMRSVTAATKKEAERQAALLTAEAEAAAAAPLSVQEAALRYVDSRRGVLSPYTIKTYLRLIRTSLAPLSDVAVTDLTNQRVQAFVSDFALDHSPKTVSSVYGFLYAVLGEAAPHLRLRIRMPQRRPPDISIPDQETVQRLIDHSDGPLRTAIVLASSMGLRRGEICALTWADIRGETLRVSRAYAQDEHNILILKSPKSVAGFRSLQIPPAAAAVLIRPDDANDTARVVPLTPDALTRRFERLCDSLQLHYRFHALRHYYASVMLSLGVPDKYAMSRMGHSTSSTLKQVYQHLMQDKSTTIDDQLASYFSK